MGRSASPRSPRPWRRTSRGSAVKIAVGVVCLALTFGMAALAFVMPYTADVPQPPRPGYEYIGLNRPTISVQCGSLLAPRTPTYPRSARYLGDDAPAIARAACDDQRPKLRTMGITSGSVGLLLLVAIVTAALRERRRVGITAV